ncbi:iron reductase [Rhodofomes roseus]|uniref:Iron reductase n=1 Tax=Rhodofomes roseus TaxID=34475 RepID=A0ABQ8KJC0_9APHY|nr:iron reductase [Rhodofomes roseus]KAH9838053.1 iron reductase [Rhodofomes roseus]
MDHGSHSPAFGARSAATSTSGSSSGGSSSLLKAVSPDKALRLARAKGYPREVWYFVACFIFLVAIFQFGSWAVNKLSKRRARTDTEAGTDTSNGRFTVRNIPRALVNAYRVILFRWTLEIGSSYTLNMAEVFVSCAYFIALFIWEFINTTDLEGEKYDIAYWGNRAGAIAAAQLPLVTALGTKNNVVSLITGIGYDKLNYVHRMTARVVCALLWVHSGNKLYDLNWARQPSYFIPAGLAAVISLTVLCILSIRPIRSNAYEFFFITHFLMIGVFLIGGYFHADVEQLGAYVWPSFLVWALDRFIRVLRVIWANHLYFSWSGKRAHLDATVELLSPHFLRVRIARPAHFHWSPAQTAYLVMPTVSLLPTESHPFTISSIEGHDTAHVLGEHAPYWNELVFLINVRDGFTKRLAKVAESGKKVKVLVEGPYGFTPDLTSDDTAVLVSGGSGVTFTLPTLLGIVNDVRAGKSRCTKIVFIWAIRDQSHVEWISKALKQALELAPPTLKISIQIYVTAGEPPVTSEKAYDDDSVHEGSGSSQEKDTPTPSLSEFTAVSLHTGRPDLRSILRDEVSVTTGRMSVTVCGSQAIARACRAALRFPVSGPSETLKGGADVILHVESFGYA